MTNTDNFTDKSLFNDDDFLDGWRESIMISSSTVRLRRRLVGRRRRRRGLWKSEVGKFAESAFSNNDAI